VSRDELKREIGGITLLAVGLVMLAVLVWAAAASAAPGGATGCDAVRRTFGGAGVWVFCRPWVKLLGFAPALLIPALPVVHALRLLGRMRQDTDRRWLAFLLGGALWLSYVIALVVRGDAPPSPVADVKYGLWGGFWADALTSVGGLGIAWTAAIVGLCVLTATTLAWNPLRVLLGAPRAPAPDDAMAAAAEAQPEEGGRRRRRRKEEPAPLEPTPEEMPAIDPSLMAEEERAEPEPEKRAAKGKRLKLVSAAEREEQIAATLAASAEPGSDADLVPPVTLLALPPARNAEVSRRELEQLGQRLVDTLRTFKVQGSLSGWTTGPVVTQFEVEPAAGVKVRQIANLANDLALAMRANSIRIVAPIPGKGAVGVEVPNPQPEMVAFREILDSPEYRKPFALPVALGKDLEGKPIVADLAKMPHLLIAGATGSGKSVCVNTIITSLVYRHTPRTLRFLMVDPKMVELSVYNDLPHLRHKVITDNKDAATVLKWAVMEMQDRYALLAENGCRNIQDFNRRVRDGAELRKPKDPELAFEQRIYTGGELPYIVVVIDEMADLMMTVQGEVETPIAMLAQKARAIGIHLILATQRPSVNVITGLIKANFPSRIAFRVASQVDSRTIIDGAGAEMLLGNGDMLFIPPGKSEPSRLQGAFLSSEETERLMGWYRDRKEGTSAEARAMAAAFDEEEDILEKVRQREKLEQGGEAGEEESDPGERDKLFRDAAEVVIQHQLGSTSLLQRRLKIGYGRAARIIDQLHDAGVLGPPDGSKARDVLIGLDRLDEICGPRA
jgi:S-DNA-T family DNA segregation ATPase FtsK/SpoIIIE